MSNQPKSGRPLSCPADTWRNEPELPVDRPRSVLAGQDPNTNNTEFPADMSRYSGASEQGEFNKAKVNPWISSEVKPDADMDNANQQPFYHYPSNTADTSSKRHCPPKTLAESLGTRPQTEPGRSRKPFFSEDLHSQQSSTEVGTSSHAPAHTAEQGAPEDWVIVDKSSSETIMPCDPDDESNVLVPSPNEVSKEPSSDNPESCEAGEEPGSEVGDNLERTRMVMTNDFGSTFQVLPQIPDRGTEGTDATEQAVVEKKDTKPSNPGGWGNISLSGIGAFAATVVKWKARRNTIEARMRRGFKTLAKEHQQILASEANTIKTEVPEGLMRTIKEEAYKMMLKTTQAYRSQIGARHKLTHEAYEYLKELKDELQRS